jgi:glycosyltransferase involved in cell wall biosynthesis
MIPNSPKGGSEILLESIKKQINITDINLFLSVCQPELLIPNKKNVLLQQLNHDQDNVLGMKSPIFVDQIDLFVYNSHWCYEKFREKFNTPPWKSIVIKNATYPFQIKSKPKGKLKLIFTSTPWRGLDVVLKSFELLNRDDVELDVYSSNVIYGPVFAQATAGQFDDLFEYGKKLKNVNMLGYTTNKNIRLALEQAHIFAYPSTFEETSCIAAIEAMCAGCQAVVTNLGALFETCGEYATYIPYDIDRTRLVKNYAKVLNNTINSYWTEENQQFLLEQAEFYNKHWTWPKRIKEWDLALNKIRNNQSVFS